MGTAAVLAFKVEGCPKPIFPGSKKIKSFLALFRHCDPPGEKVTFKGKQTWALHAKLQFCNFHWWLKNQNWILISFYCLLLRHYWAWILGGQKKRKMFFFFAFGRTIWTALFFTLFIRRGLTLVLGSKKWKAHQCAILC